MTQPTWADEEPPRSGLEAQLALCQTEPGREMIVVRDGAIFGSASVQTAIKRLNKGRTDGRFEVRSRPSRDHMFRVDVLVKWMPIDKE